MTMNNAETESPKVEVVTDGNYMLVTISKGPITVTRKFVRGVYTPNVHLDTVLTWAWDDWAKATQFDGEVGG